MAETTTAAAGEIPEETPPEGVSAINVLSKREKLKQWLYSKDVDLGGLYEGAILSLYTEQPGPGWAYITAHAGRELGNRLPDVVSGTERVSRLNYDGEVQKISKLWVAARMPYLGAEEATTTTIETYTIPREVYERLSRLVEDNNEAGTRKERKARLLFETLVPGQEPADQKPAIEQWMEVVTWFSERAHIGRTQVESHTVYREKLEAMEGMLYALVESSEDFSQLPAELNEILENTNN
jgi:hypothetical protein